MSFSRIFLFSQIFFILGIFLASFFDFPFYFYFSFAFLLLLFLPIFLKNKVFFLPILLFFFVFGIFWEDFFEIKQKPFCQKNVCNVNFFNKKETEFEGKVISSKESLKTTQVILQAKKALKGNQVLLAGKVLLFLPKGVDLKRGEILKIKGKLQDPKNLSSLWQNYLKKERILSVIFYPEIETKGVFQSFFEKSILNLKERLKKAASLLPPPEGALLLAITLADRSKISENLEKILSQSGLYHIIAISGLHILLLFEILISFFIFLGLWRRETTFLTIFLLLFYLFLINFPPSAKRAFVMGSILYLGLALGRLSFSFQSLTLATSLILISNPFALRYDPGFQLSFLASFGIITLAPKIKKALGNQSLFKNIFSMNLSAQIFTLPLSLYYFKTLPIFGILANILILPFLPYLLFFSFLFLILGIFSLKLAYLLSFLLKIPYFLLFKIAQILSKGIELKIPLFFIPFLYLILIIFLLKFKKGQKNKVL
jgi:competence protein ComEC